MSPSSTTTLLGQPFPPPAPPHSSHPLLSGSPLVPLRVLLCNFTKRTHDHFHDLLEQLEQQPDELQRRHALLQSLRSTQLTLTRLRLLVSWLAERGEEYDRLGDMAAVLRQRDAAYGLSVDMLNLLARHVDASLPPAYDVSTAVHVLGRGDYRLLPRQVETVLDVKRVLSAAQVADIKRRLDDQLYTALLSSRLPPSLSLLAVRGGVVRIGAGGWVATVSLRMMPRGEVDVPEQSRVKWRLFGLRWLLHVSGDPADVAVVADAQTAALIGRCNALMHSSDEPLLLMHRTLQTFVHTLTLALLNHQLGDMQQHYAAQAVHADFIPGQSLAVRYWREAQSIPQGDASASSTTSSAPTLSSSTLLFTLHGSQLSVSHSPPLPQMEAVSAKATAGPAISFSIDPRSISLPRLFTRVLASHARHRIQQLHAFLLRQSKAANQAPWDSIAVDSGEGEEQSKRSEEEGEQEERVDADEQTQVRDVLAIGLADGWTVHARVDQQSGRFVFSWADVLPSAASASSNLASSLSTLASLSNLSTLFASLTSLRHEARLLHYQQAIASLHAGQTVMRFPPVRWSVAIPPPAPTKEATLLFVRLSSSPFFFLLLCFSVSSTASPPALYFLHCESAEPLPALAATATAPSAAGAASKRRAQYCDLLSPVACNAISATDLSAPSSLHTVPSTATLASASHPLSLVYRALCYCEERVPAAVFMRQLSALPVSNITQLSASSFAFTTPHPPAPQKPIGEARITITIAPHAPYVDAPASSLQSVARCYPVPHATGDALLASGVRYGWSAAIEQSTLIRMYRELARHNVDVNTRPLGMQFIHSSEGSAAPAAPSTVSFYYASMSASPLSSVLSDLWNLYMCAQFANEALSIFSVPPDRFAQYDAIAPGDQPPPGLFSVASCSTDLYSIRYNLAALEGGSGGGGVADECWLLLRKHSSELESSHYLQLGGQRQIPIFTLHFRPYAFPHHDYLEWDFNHRYDIKTLLKHVYWGALAVRHIHRFMQRVSQWDRAAGYHHLHFHQSVAFTAPVPDAAAAVPGQPPPLQMVLMPVTPAVHTVSVLPQSATRLRFLFRKQYKQTKVDIRLLNGYTFVQDFLSTTPQLGGATDEKRQPPGKVPLRALDSYLTSWYQWCGQYEQWRRVQKHQQAKHFTLPVHFDKAQLNSRPTSRTLIDIRLGEGSPLHADEAEALCRFYRQWVCVPPYSPECMHSFLALCALPLGVQRAMCELLQLQLQSHDPATAAATGRLAVRWVHHLSAPFDLMYAASHDVLQLIVHLVDRRRGESVYLPLAYTVSSGSVALWENEQQESVADNRSVTIRNERRLRRMLPPVDGPAVGCGPAAEEWLRRESWPGLGALLSALMALELGEVVHAVTAALSPAMSVDEWCRAATNRIVSADNIRAEAAAVLQAAQRRELGLDIPVVLG